MGYTFVEKEAVPNFDTAL